MKAAWSRLRRFLEWLDADDDPHEPRYDPTHLGAALVASFAVIGALYWLLWTLFVYEGGLLSKIGALFGLLLTSRTLADYGYHGTPYAMGVFEGWLANSVALAIFLAILASGFQLYREAARRHHRK